jgi:hypothetical protein
MSCYASPSPFPSPSLTLAFNSHPSIIVQSIVYVIVVKNRRCRESLSQRVVVVSMVNVVNAGSVLNIVNVTRGERRG